MLSISSFPSFKITRIISSTDTMLVSVPSASSSPSSEFFKLLVNYLLISTILIVFNLPSTISSTAFYTCSDTEYTYQSLYSANLETLLFSLIKNTTATGFFNTTVGVPPDAVYGFALCRGDLTPTQCQQCVSQAANDAMMQCLGRRRAALWYDLCRIRYSDESFFSTLTEDVPSPYYYSYNTVPDRELFRLKIGKLFKDLQERAAYGKDFRMFAAASINYTAGQSLYGLMQCTRDLSGDQCTQCLNNPIGQIVCCQQSNDLTFQGGSCYLRYSLDQFYNSSVASPPSKADNVQAGGMPSGPKGKKKSIFALVMVIVGGAILVLVLAIFLRIRRKRKPKHITLGRNLNLQEGGGLKFHRLTSRKASLFHGARGTETPLNDSQKLDLHTIKIATENFSDSRRLGRGEFGPVYKGDIHGREFVVKKLTGRPQMGLEELRGEFKSLKQIQHPNLVRLIAYLLDEEDKLLVYEYLPNTSLDRILFDPKKRVLLDWGRRYKIIEGIGRGLLHLHEESGMNIIHQNLKPSNILLDKNMTPKISDYCMAKLFIGSQTQGGTRKTAASQGYTENVTSGTLSVKTDIFSYGVLVLEIVTGQRNRDFLGSENTTNLLSYVWQYWREEKALQVLDWSLGELYKAHEVLRCIHIGLLCAQENVENRPNISTVVHMLNSYSFTLPSPSAPSITRVRKPTKSDLPPKNNESTGNFDWKVFNQSVSQLSPQTPSGWSDVQLETQGQTRR